MNINIFSNGNDKMEVKSAENTVLGTEEYTVTKLHEAENSTERSDKRELEQDISLTYNRRKNVQSHEGFRGGESGANANNRIMALSNN